MYMEVLAMMTDLWDESTGEDKQQMARMMFEEIVYDLERLEIVDFRLKPWADRFLILRAQLYDDDPTGVGGEESGVGEGKENPYAPGQDLHTKMPHRSFGGANRSKTRGWVDFRPRRPLPALPRTLAA